MGEKEMGAEQAGTAQGYTRVPVEELQTQ